MNEETMNHIT